MNPTDPTATHAPNQPADSSESDWDAGLAAAFGLPQARPQTPPPEPEVGAVLAGKYRLTERIGEGGMGSVWVAQQTEPVKRRVAIKLIKAGMDSKTVLARFEAERQALAVMDHPNIAKVLDGGLHDGRPFFVMELVKGVPITDYCDARKLTPRERLELFLPVCHAIQHAHQKGIIHRDIKPSNVLIALYDDRPVPKVIDFGVAKSTGGTLTEQTIETAFGGVIGTPQYMSPEQATLNNLDIDTRSDVYSLGVVLYELLTGSPPFARQELEKQGLLEMLRVVREVEPPKPSTKLSSAAALPTLAANRGTEPGKLTKLLRSELDWIVLKALEKDRARRYETANGFARDVQRYLAGEPVLAAPPSARYRLRKFVRRNRVGVFLTLFAAASLVAVVFNRFLASQEVRAERDRALVAAEGERLAKLQAQAEKAKAEQAAAKEKAANEQAQKRLKQIEKANDLLGSIFENLDPKAIAKAERPLQAILVEKLDQAVAQLEGESIGDPLVVAAMQVKFGRSLLGLGEPGKAIVLLEKARATRHAKLGSDHPDTLASMGNLAEAYREAGKHDLAVPLGEETLKLMKAKFDPDHPETLTCMNNLAAAYWAARKLDLALPLFEKTVKLMKARFGREHPNTLGSMHNLASVYQAAGKPDLALPLFEETLKLKKARLGPEHPDTLISMNNLAVAYKDAGKVDRAVPLSQEALRLRRAKLGPDHPHTLASMGNLAEAYREAEKHDLAVPLREEMLKLKKAKLGPDHPDTLTSMHNLAAAYLAAGKLDLAVPLGQETVKLMTAKLGPDHLDTLTSMGNLAAAYRDAGKLDLAVPLFEEALKLLKSRLGPEHPHTLTSVNNLATAYQAAGKPGLAVPLHEETLKLTKAKFGPDHPDTLTSMNNLAAAYEAAGKLDLALLLHEETLKLRKAKVGPDHHDTLTSMNNLAAAYHAAGKREMALPLFEEALTLQKTKLGTEHPLTLRTMNNLAAAYRAAGKLDLALSLGEETLKLRKASLGSDHPDTLTSMNDLAAGYWRAKQLDKSIPLFEETLKRQEAKLGRDHPDTLLTVANLGVNYKDAGRLREGIALLEEAHRAAKKDPRLRTFGPALLDAYTKAGESAEAVKLARQLLADARKALPKNSPQLASTVAQYSLTLLLLKAYADAEPLLRECLAIREEKDPDAWTTFNTKSMLGGALLGQKKYADAEPLLLTGYEGMKQREKLIPPQGKVRIPEALDRLIELYTATNKPDEVKKWQAERAKYPEMAPPPREQK